MIELRNFDELKNFKTNKEIDFLNLFQILNEEIKQKKQEKLPQGVWVTNMQKISWEYLENKAWYLMKEHGISFKLFTTWFECYLHLKGIDSFLYLLTSIDILFENKFDIFDDASSEISYFDKKIAIALNESEINFESINAKLSIFEIERLKKQNSEELKQILMEINSFEIELLEDLAKKIESKINSLYSKFNTFTFKFTNIENKIYLIDFFSKLYKDVFENIEMQESNFNEINYEAPSTPSNFDEAYNHIFKAIEIFEKSDNNNLALPALKKIANWRGLHSQEIFNSLNSDDEILALIKFLKNK